MWLIVSEIVEEGRDTLAHYAWPLCTTNMSEWRIVGGLKIFTAKGAERFSSARRCEVKMLHSVAIKCKWISLTAAEAPFRLGNISLILH